MKMENKNIENENLKIKKIFVYNQVEWYLIFKSSLNDLNLQLNNLDTMEIFQTQLNQKNILEFFTNEENTIKLFIKECIKDIDSNKYSLDIKKDKIVLKLSDNINLTFEKQKNEEIINMLIDHIIKMKKEFKEIKEENKIKERELEENKKKIRELEEIKMKVSELEEIKMKVRELEEIKKKVSELEEIKKKVSELEEKYEKLQEKDVKNRKNPFQLLEKLDEESDNNRNNKDDKINKVINDNNNNNVSDFLSGRKYNESIKINDNNILTNYNIENNDLNKNIKTINYNQIDKKNKSEIQKICEIYLNDQKVDFKFEHKFKQTGEYKLKFIFKNLLTDSSYLFYNSHNLQKINLSKFKTDNVCDMRYMFSDCDNLEEINLSNIKTNKVVNMKCMFNNCSSLINLDLSSFTTNEVKNMENMFYNCKSLFSINLSSFNTNNVETMKKMFGYCENLEELNLSNFTNNNQKIKDISFMFTNCLNLKKINFSNFITTPQTNVTGIFNNIKEDCNKLLSMQEKNISK